MKRILGSWLCLLILMMAFAFPAFAQSLKVIDEAGLLTEYEVAELEKKASQLAQTYEMDVVILTVDDLGGKNSQDYADDYYDDNGYGKGSERSGVLFLIAMETRDWYIFTCGNGIYALTDYSIQVLFSEISWDFSNGYYYDAFNGFLEGLIPYFEAFENGEPIDGYQEEYTGPNSYQPGVRDETVYYPQEDDKPLLPILLGSMAIGLIAATVSLLVMRSQMNTAKLQSGANSYVVSGSYDLVRRHDIFLYSHVSKTCRADNDCHGGHGGGGSSVQHSNGGSRHGGGGGKF